MTYLILDADIIIRYPKLLATSSDGVKLAIAADVITELSKKKGLDRLLNERISLIEKAMAGNLLQLFEVDKLEVSTFLQDGSLDEIDNTTILLAYSLLHKGNDVQVATLDRQIISHPPTEIHVLSETEIKERLSLFRLHSSGLKNRAIWLLRAFRDLSMRSIDRYFPSAFTDKFITEFESLETQILLYQDKELVTNVWSVFISFIIIGLGYFVVRNIHAIVGTIQVWGTVVSIVLVGFLLFIIREKQRLVYGIVELLVGVLSITYIFMNYHFEYAQIKFDFDFTFKLLGGCYIMVRGQDNILKAISQKSLGVFLKNRWGLGK